METKETGENAGEVFTTWQVEDNELAKRLRMIRDWMRQVSQYGAPRFGETATKLSQLRTYLVTHFAHEIELCDRLMALPGKQFPEIDLMREQSVEDHRHLLADLDSLIARLNELDPPFVSWQSAMAEVEAFAATLEQHETQESKSVKAITQNEAGSNSHLQK